MVQRDPDNVGSELLLRLIRSGNPPCYKPRQRGFAVRRSVGIGLSEEFCILLLKSACLKIWKYLRNVPVSSCYLEMRAAKHLDGESSYLPFWDLYLALDKGKANLAMARRQLTNLEKDIQV